MKNTTQKRNRNGNKMGFPLSHFFSSFISIFSFFSNPKMAHTEPATKLLSIRFLKKYFFVLDFLPRVLDFLDFISTSRVGRGPSRQNCQNRSKIGLSRGKVDILDAKFGTKMCPNLDPKCAQIWSQIFQVTTHSLYKLSPKCSHFGPKMCAFWMKKWCHFGSEIDQTPINSGEF